jgi:hypothetical protein
MRTLLRWTAAATLLVACGGSGEGGGILPGDDDRPDDTEQVDETDEVDDTEVDGTDETEPGGADTTAPDGTEPADVVLTVDDSGFEAVELSWGDIGVNAAATVTNTTDQYIETLGYDVAFLDASGTEVETTIGSVSGIPPGERAILVAGSTFDPAEPAIADVVFTLDPPVLTDGPAFASAENGAIDLRDVVLTVDPATFSISYNDEVQVNALVHNLGDQRVTDIWFSCLMRRGGTIVGGTEGSIAEILPGGTGGLSAMPRFDVPMPDSAECRADAHGLTQVTAPTERRVELVSSGFSTAPRSYTDGFDVYAAAVLRNPSSDALVDVRVQFDLYDAAGALVIVGGVYTEYLAPGEEAVFTPILVPGTAAPASTSMVVGVSAFSVQPVTATVGIVGNDPFDLTPWTVLTADGVYDGDSTPFEGTITNPTAWTILGGLTMYCSMMSGGVAVGGAAFSVLDPIPAGGSAPFTVYTNPLSTTPAHDDVMCTVHINAILETDPPL